MRQITVAEKFRPTLSLVPNSRATRIGDVGSCCRFSKTKKGTGRKYAHSVYFQGDCGRGFSLSIATIASAQASRTWVSGVGDDANPCSRTAPCKTFAGAISKTANGGEIDALDPAGYGAVTITKGITIDGNGWGSVLVSGTNGIVISDSTDAKPVVILRNLSINGIGTGINGVQIIQVGTTQGQVALENVEIFGFTNRAVNVTATVPVNVSISECHFYNCQMTAVAVLPSSITADKVSVKRSTISNNGLTAGTAGGVFANNGGKIVVSDTNMSFNTAAAAEAGTNGEVVVDNCVMEGNQFGAKTSGGTLWLSRSFIYGSTGGSAVSNAGGSLFTFGDNKMASNGTNNTGTAASPGNQ